MLYWKMIHVVAVMFAVALAMGPEFLLFRAGRSGDVRTIRSTFALAEPLSKVAHRRGEISVWAGPVGVVVLIVLMMLKPNLW